MEFVRTLSASGGAKPPAQDWPLEVRLLCTALERGALYPKERRGRSRDVRRGRVSFRFVDRNGQPQVAELYVRNASGESVAFLTSTLLRAGQAGAVELDAAGGPPQSSKCRIVRCRQFQEGWFEGALEYPKE